MPALYLSRCSSSGFVHILLPFCFTVFLRCPSFTGEGSGTVRNWACSWASASGVQSVGEGPALALLPPLARRLFGLAAPRRCHEQRTVCAVRSRETGKVRRASAACSRLPGCGPTTHAGCCSHSCIGGSSRRALWFQHCPASHWISVLNLLLRGRRRACRRRKADGGRWRSIRTDARAKR
jgi:hypothetical protein